MFIGRLATFNEAAAQKKTKLQVMVDVSRLQLSEAAGLWWPTGRKEGKPSQPTCQAILTFLITERLGGLFRIGAFDFVKLIFN